MSMMPPSSLYQEVQGHNAHSERQWLSRQDDAGVADPDDIKICLRVCCASHASGHVLKFSTDGYEQISFNGSQVAQPDGAPLFD